LLRARLLAAQSTPTGVPANVRPVATEAATPATISLLPGWHIVYQNALTTASDLWPSDADCFFASDGYHI
jgi:hypothetical protein